MIVIKHGYDRIIYEDLHNLRTKSMKILADENIPYVRRAFGAVGDVVTISGRAIDADAVRDAEMLLVRSITKVDRALLEGSAVRFVGTATIGEDHIDTGYLAERGIAFASAPGSNANSVGEYMVAALLELAHRFRFRLEGMKLGIVGVGNVGGRVLRKASAMGMECVLSDPPLARRTKKKEQSQASEMGRDCPLFFSPIEEIFDCDIVTLHVPLTKEGPDATYHLAGEAFIGNMKPGSVLINTARGPVADGEALKRALDSGHLKACVLDVWEGEPNVDVELLDRVFISTPHIAGYSLDGKVNGTRQIYEAACRCLGVESTWDPAPLLPPPECAEVRVPGDAKDLEEAVRGAVRAVYDIMADDAAMREILEAPDHERGPIFDRLRKEYPSRREFFNTRATVLPPNGEVAAQLAGIGFQTSGP